MSDNVEILNYIKHLESRIKELESVIETLNTNNKELCNRLNRRLALTDEKTNVGYDYLDKITDSMNEQIILLDKKIHACDKKIELNFNYLNKRIDDLNERNADAHDKIFDALISLCKY